MCSLAGLVEARPRCAAATQSTTITARGTGFELAAVGGPGSASVETRALGPGMGRSWLVESLTKSERPDLAAAHVVVSGSRGLSSSENSTAYSIRRSMPAYASDDLQVGQTGQVVAPHLCVAVGISGAIQASFRHEGLEGHRCHQ